jgi:hypothetical protein
MQGRRGCHLNDNLKLPTIQPPRGMYNPEEAINVGSGLMGLNFLRRKEDAS